MITTAKAATKQRLLSLDFFRGLTVATMILVNNPGDWGHIYSPLEHSVWNGCTPTDLVFPFFLFMVGVSINYAIGPKKENNVRHAPIILTALKRAVVIYIIFAVMALMWNFDLKHFRVMGVLPRIAVVFFICVILFLKTSGKALMIIFFSILLLYYLLMNFIDVPGFGPSNLEPGTNLAAWLDRMILTEQHMWNGTKTWDPEGILSTLSSVATCIFGMLIGGLLRDKQKTDSEKTSWMMVIALFTVVAGLIWGTFFPINKALWTSSFVLYTGGLATAGLAASFWLIDVQKRKKFIDPFVAFGTNAITAYVLADVVLLVFGFIRFTYNGHVINIQQFYYNNFIAANLSPVNASVIGAVVYVLILLIPIWILYKKKIFIKV